MQTRRTQTWGLEHSRYASLTPEHTCSPERLGQLGGWSWRPSLLNFYSLQVKDNTYAGELLTNIC